MACSIAACCSDAASCSPAPWVPAPRGRSPAPPPSRSRTIRGAWKWARSCRHIRCRRDSRKTSFGPAATPTTNSAIRTRAPRTICCRARSPLTVCSSQSRIPGCRISIQPSTSSSFMGWSNSHWSIRSNRCRVTRWSRACISSSALATARRCSPTSRCRPPPKRCMGFAPTPNGPVFPCPRCWRRPASIRRRSGCLAKVPTPCLCIAACRSRRRSMTP